MRLFASFILGAVLLSLVILPLGSQAQTANTSVDAQINVIVDVSKKLTDLKAQIKTAGDQQDTEVFKFLTNLRQGSEGDAVKALQLLLAADPDIYPEGLVTGYFGRATERALKRFQKANNLDQVGRVGPKTLTRLYKLLDKFQIEADGVGVVKKSSGSAGGNRDHSPDCKIAIRGFFKGNAWWKRLFRNICDVNVGNGTTTPDTVAPVISETAIGDISQTGAEIRWKTNENANSKVYYGTTSPLNLSTALTESESGLVKNHEVDLEGLLAATTYYVIVTSRDAAGNTATSSQFSFTTAAAPDTAAPLISAITVQNVATTSATVNWTTNESSTSKIYYGTSNPLNLGTANVIQNTSLTTNHSLSLTGLLASTTYSFVVESKDAGNNTGTSSQQSFTTTP